ncbi:hypothetical protein OPV22_029637 [Ensete ventricosum]|uniref:Uncharacterized protein n=1 Tax=Ensete ventricosum TaxID=4639 RepID=A0AAV8PY17_ENSVE|nr:hypothetical protein OPV22_029637 [Ensete ventricosum]
MKSLDGTRVGKCLPQMGSRRVRFTKQVRTTTNRFLIGISAGSELPDHLFVRRASEAKQLIRESRDSPLKPNICPPSPPSLSSLSRNLPRERIKSFLPRNFACYVLWISLSKGVGWMLLSRSLGHGSQSRETREPSRPEPIRERRGRGGRG